MVASILSLSDSLLALADRKLSLGQPTSALNLLHRWRQTRNDPTVDGLLLLGKACFALGQWSDARNHCRQALEQDPDHADVHELLAKLAEVKQSSAVLTHAGKAVGQTFNPKQQAAFARRLNHANRTDLGLELLAAAHAEHPEDWATVERYVEALIDAGRWRDAELTLTLARRQQAEHATFRQHLPYWRRRLRVAQLWAKSPVAQPADRPDVLRFEHPIEARFPTTAANSLPVLDPDMDLSAVLHRLDRRHRAKLAVQFGELPARVRSAQVDQLCGLLLSTAVLRRLLSTLPASSLQWLRTLRNAGGWAPANVLFQTTADAPSPRRAALPLLHRGLIYFGRDKDQLDRLIVMIPHDLATTIDGCIDQI